jgi:predicted PurR-regulated permease PerM
MDFGSPDATAAPLVEQLAGLMAVGLLLGLAYLVIAPFLVALVWAAILVFVTWKPFEGLARALRSRTLAAVLMVAAFGLIILVPLVVAGIELSAKVDAIGAWYQHMLQTGWPAVPHWIANLPWIGSRIDKVWTGLAAGDPVVVAKMKEWSKPLVGILLTFGAALGSGVLLMLLSLLLAFFIYLSGTQLVQWLFAVLARIADKRGKELLNVAAVTVRGVVYGIIGTALLQGVLAFGGYWIAGVPNPLAFGLLTCLVSPIPGGPSLVGLPVALWLYQHGETGWAIGLAIWVVAVVSTVDNVVRPLLIGKQSDLPFVLILIGVAGGALAWGALGVFLGPTLLAVCYSVLRYWAFPEKMTLKAGVSAGTHGHTPGEVTAPRLQA